jgi:phosphoribosylaminoimidazole-succinocarboxamide synthase
MTNLPPVLYRGSVKNVRGEVSAESLLFEFSDRYSVFDWGEMPDQLDGKGQTLAIMGKSFFQYLGEASNWEGLFSSDVLNQTFSHDYLTALSQSEIYKKYCAQGLNHHAAIEQDEFNTPYLKVKNINIIRPSFDGVSYHYEAYTDKPVNALVPLEVIFRLGLSHGNSLTKRLGVDLSKWRAFGFNEIPEAGLLKTPIIDFSTKLERGDRYLDYSEALSISGMNDSEWIELQQMTNLIALNLFRFHHDLGLELWDGKIEVGFIPGTKGHRSFMLVDSIGIDELRLLYKGKSFSKEFLRETYKESTWFNNLELSKKDVLTSGGDFKEVCLTKYKSSPMPLNPEVKARAEAVYKSYSNAVTSKVLGKKFFTEEFNLEDYSKRYL